MYDVLRLGQHTNAGIYVDFARYKVSPPAVSKPGNALTEGVRVAAAISFGVSDQVQIR
jgi:hypothetical protein